ncbi:MAG: hypothetical protein DME92_01235 [Verrucomicrobia bacterium]|nr:MAG: hypothetical protein DME92_01235 [Verrucomicrobiota bacterium]
MCRVRDGVGDGLVTAGAVVVAVVPCFCVQEATNAMPISAAIKHNMYLFIGCQFQFEYRGMFGCLKSSQRATNESFSSSDSLGDAANSSIRRNKIRPSASRL